MLKRAIFTPAPPPRAETRVSRSVVLAPVSVERCVLGQRLHSNRWVWEGENNDRGWVGEKRSLLHILLKTTPC